MRWIHLDHNNPVEAARYRETLALIDRWWAEFEAKAGDLNAMFDGKSEWDLAAWMDETLQRIDPHLMWEFGQAVKTKGHRLVITPEHRHDLRPLVTTILERAPRIDGWEFYPVRLAEPWDEAQLTVEGRTGGDIATMLARVSVGGGHRVDLVMHVPGFTSDEEAARRAAFVAVESLLGEAILNEWIGAIEVEPIPEEKRGWFGRKTSANLPGLIGLDRLCPTVEALIDSIRSQLPPRPWLDYRPGGEESIGPSGEPFEWSLLKCSSPEADDYAESDDLITAITIDPDLWEASHRAPAFYSKRYSRHDEMFAYLKIDGRPDPEASKFEDRESIENAIDDALTNHGAGCVIGGGTGRIYSYVDLALTDVDRAATVVREVLRAGHIEKRSWLLFCDAHLSQEWVGIYDDTPAPPLRPLD